MGEDFTDAADVVFEVVSGDDNSRRRDLIRKREDYARARIPEYWTIDPAEEQIVVLYLDGEEYAVHGTFARGQAATSRHLPGFALDVTEILSARE